METYALVTVLASKLVVSPAATAADDVLAFGKMSNKSSALLANVLDETDGLNVTLTCEPVTQLVLNGSAARAP